MSDQNHTTSPQPEPQREPQSEEQPQAQPEPAQQRPADTLRDGNIKATIWERQGETGPFHATTLARTYRDEQGEYRDSHSFSGTDLLRVSELAKDAYHRTNELRREQMQDRDADQDREARRQAHHDARSTSSRDSRDNNRDR